MKKLENLFVAMNIESNKRKKALLLHYAGDEVFEIHATLDNTGNENDYAASKTALENYFKPQLNTEFQVFEYRQMKQNQSETVDKFATRLRQKAVYCDFTNKDRELKSQLIQGCKSQKLRRKILQENLDLPNILLTARQMELANEQAGKMVGTSASEDAYATNAVRNKKNRERNHRQPQRQPPSAPSGSRDTDRRKTEKCRNCGGTFPHKTGQCPAKGKTCNYCHKQNHFVVVCMKKKRKEQRIKQVRDNSNDDSEIESDAQSTDSEHAFGIQINKIRTKQPKVDISVNGRKCRMLVDTGSTINLLNETILNKMKTKPKLSKPDTDAYAYGQKRKLPIKGKFTGTIETSNKITTAMFYVINGNYDSLISYETSVELGLVPEINSVTSNSVKDSGNVKNLINEYSGLFEGIGKLKDKEIKLHIDESVPPVAQPHRRIPFHMREKVEKELQRLEQLDIIEKVDGPTEWVSPIVVAPKKNGEIRLCVDMRQANKAIKRERHITPTIDDIIAKLNGAKVFSKTDMNQGFHQCVLSHGSRNITVFSTHVGLRRYKRLNYGISASPEIFQNEVRKALEGLEGCLKMSDDIIIYGENQEEHDRNLKAVFERFKQKNLTLNKNKCTFSQKQVKFFGFIFSDKGISADPEKVEAIKRADRPNSSSEVRSFLGMVGYVSRFIHDYSTITEPLRKLTKSDEPWIWAEEQENAFQTLKNILSSDTVMSYFDPAKETQLRVDASPVGLAAILSQDNKIVAYASRALSPVEQRYSQTERECLSIVWGIEHFHLYVYGKSFTLISDHKPLIHILGTQASPKSKRQSLRLERWRLRLVTYDFTIRYEKGALNVSDYLSRHPIANPPKTSIAEDYVNFIASHSLPNALTLSDIANATKEDPTLQNVIKAVKSNNWSEKLCKSDKMYNAYAKLCHELTVLEVNNQEIILRGTRLVIPENLQKHCVDLAHDGHMGIVKTKALLREKVWFPFLDVLVEDKCKHCIPCLAVSPRNPPEPVKVSELPQKPWDEVSIDFLGSIDGTNYCMVVICDYSRYPVVETLTSLSAKAVIPRLDRIFSMFGIPSVCRTDSGPPFQGDEFRQFAKRMGFKHRRITPLNPRANSVVERFMSPLQKAIKSAVIEGRDYKQEINKFLRNFRACPHPSTGLSPAESCSIDQ